MRLDAASPRTWLLAAVAGWALLGWMLALGGMGGRLEPMQADPGLLPPVPPLPAAPPSRLQPYDRYGAIAERPLFAEDRRPHPFFLQGAGEPGEDDAFNYVLTSVLLTPQVRMAILQPPDGGRSVRVRLDEAPSTHPSWRLVGLDERSAVFTGPEGERTLELRVYDGVGGRPPTPVAAPDAPQPGTDPRIPIAPPPVANRRPSQSPSQSPQSAAERARSDAPRVEPDPDDAPDPEESRPSPPMTEEAQMDAIRQRIQARREQLRRQQSAQPPDENR